MFVCLNWDFISSHSSSYHIFVAGECACMHTCVHAVRVLRACCAHAARVLCACTCVGFLVDHTMIQIVINFYQVITICTTNKVAFNND